MIGAYQFLGRRPGGAASLPTTYVQKATIRLNTVSGTVSLGSTPTVGNLMVFICAGYPGSSSAFFPAGFSTVGRYTLNNQHVTCLARLVQSGDTGSYSISAGAVTTQSGVLYEFANAKSVMPIIGGAISGFFSGSNFSVPTFPTLWAHGDIVLGALEHEGVTDFSLTGETGLTEDYNAGDANDHSAVFFQLAATHDGLLSGSIASGSPTDPIMGLFAVVGTAGAD